MYCFGICLSASCVLSTPLRSYRPDLVDLSTMKDCSVAECNELAFAIIEHEMGISRIMSAQESVKLDAVDSKIWLNYLEQICDVFRGEVPHVKHPKLVCIGSIEIKQEIYEYWNNKLLITGLVKNSRNTCECSTGLFASFEVYIASHKIAIQ